MIIEVRLVKDPVEEERRLAPRIEFLGNGIDGREPSFGESDLLDGAALAER